MRDGTPKDVCGEANAGKVYVHYVKPIHWMKEVSCNWRDTISQYCIFVWQILVGVWFTLE